MKSTGRPSNGPSTTGRPSGRGRGNNAPRGGGFAFGSSGLPPYKAPPPKPQPLKVGDTVQYRWCAQMHKAPWRWEEGASPSTHGWWTGTVVSKTGRKFRHRWTEWDPTGDWATEWYILWHAPIDAMKDTHVFGPRVYKLNEFDIKVINED